jgi:hypothetical protein
VSLDGGAIPSCCLLGAFLAATFGTGSVGSHAIGIAVNVEHDALVIPSIRNSSDEPVGLGLSRKDVPRQDERESRFAEMTPLRLQDLQQFELPVQYTVEIGPVHKN